MNRDKGLKPKQIKERELILKQVYAELVARAEALAKARLEQSKTLENEISQLRSIYEAEKQKTMNLKNQVKNAEANISKLANAKFVKAYSIRIQEYKDMMVAIKNWKDKFISKDEMEAELRRIQSYGKL